MFTRSSRYAGVGDHKLTDEAGREVPYKKVRLIPPTPGVRPHVVAAGERPDHIAHRHFRDAELFWRICDANAVMHPEELVELAGTIIHVPAAER